MEGCSNTLKAQELELLSEEVERSDDLGRLREEVQLNSIRTIY